MTRTTLHEGKCGAPDEFETRNQLQVLRLRAARPDQNMEDHPFNVTPPRESWLAGLASALSLRKSPGDASAPADVIWRRAALSLANIQPATNFVISDSLARLRGGVSVERRFAVVTPMPSAETGIANSSLETFCGHEGGVDFFTRFEDILDYVHFSAPPQDGDRVIEAFDLAALPVALATRKYAAVVICLGNSHHNLPAANLFRHLAAFPPSMPVIIHLHDPWLLDIWTWTAGAVGRSVRTDLAAYYGIFDPKNRNVRQMALNAGTLGLCAVIGDARVSGIVVNSIHAESLVRRELDLARRNISVLRAFLPVLPTKLRPTPHKPGTQTLRLGTFGVPGPSKRTLDVIGAARMLAADGAAESLVLAGYGVSNFVSNLPRQEKEAVRAFNAPANAVLESLMAEVHVAVQLRAEGRGESSGIVPQLLALGTPVVVSAVGSFPEFGDAVVQIPSNANTGDIVAGIKSASERREYLKVQAAQYCATHSPGHFTALLESFVASLPRHTEAATAPNWES